MSRAGYDPRAALSFWRKMSSGKGGEPPELLSSHPSDVHRVRDLEAAVPRYIPVYQHAR